MTSFTPKRRWLRGFTLVELLVVIGIIALLIGMLLPALSHARESASQIKCMANLHTIGQAIYIYVGDNNGTLPIGQVLNGEVIAGNTITYVGDGTDWTILVAYELNRTSVTTYTSVAASTLNSASRSFFICPSAPESQVTTGAIFTDYSSHPRIIPDLGILDGTTTEFSPRLIKTYLQPYKLVRIRRPSDIAMIFDASVSTENGAGFWDAYQVARGLDNGSIFSGTLLTDNYLYVQPKNAGTPINTASGDGLLPFSAAYYNTDSNQNVQNIRFRHAGNRKANVLMVDGHVQVFNYNPNSHVTDLLEGNIVLDQ